ncbi:MAG: EamA family transporter, partial [Nanoarchaeota archaeon]|nr:EamA family transporter [Nanoarchaeota archaeon]
MVILSSIFFFFFSFLLKVSAANNHNSSLVNTYSMFSCSIIGLGIFLLSINNYNPLWLLFLISLGNAIFYFIAIVTRIEGLRNIDTTIYFPLYKTFGPILMVFVGIIFFADNLTYSEYFGVFLGILIPLLLIHNKEKKRQKNLKLGLIYLVLGIIFGVSSSTMGKLITYNNLNIFLFIFISFFLGGLISLYAYKKTRNNSKNNSLNKIKRTGWFNGLLLFLSVYFFTKSTIGSNLGVVYTINSFSLLIPIILSIIFYKEHFDTKKGIAIAPTILSLIFLK